MTALVWDAPGEKFFETGVSNGVLYPIDGSGAYPMGYAWNGLVNITETPSGAEPTPLYADNIKYLNLISAEELGLTIEAYTYPDEWASCDGSAVDTASDVIIGQQPRTMFGLAYKTKIGNDVDGDLAYKLHLVYGCLASPSERAYNSINDSPEAIAFSWEVATTPVPVTGFQPTSLIIIDSRTADPTALAAFELVLFGDVATDPELPLPDEVIAYLTP